MTGSDPTLMALYVVLLGGLGLIVGSFLNVVIYRVPLGLSIVRPGSACPACHTPIAVRDNIPVLSWVLLRGRCRSCSVRIPIRYPLVEIANAVIWLAAGAWAAHPEGIDPLLPLLLILGSAGLALSAIDLEHYRLPDAIVLPLYPVTAVGLVFAGVVSGEWTLTAALVGAMSWLIVIGGLWLVSGGRGMGFGDVKVSPVLGVTLGWVGLGSALVGLFAAFLLGAVVGLGLLVTRRAGRRSRLPFGPFLFAGTAVGVLAGEAIAGAYMGMLGG